MGCGVIRDGDDLYKVKQVVTALIHRSVPVEAEVYEKKGLMYITGSPQGFTETGKPAIETRLVHQCINE
jgi:hypothetical protein